MDERFKIGFKPIRSFNNDHWKKNLFGKKKIREFNYGKDFILLGYEPKTTEPVFIDATEALRMVVVGSTRSGKTFLLNTICSRLLKSGWHTAFLSDVKDEQKFMTSELQEKFRSMLAPREQPTAFKSITFRPTFFRDFPTMAKLPAGNSWISPDLTKMQLIDFRTLMNYDELTVNQQIMIDEVFEIISHKEQKIDNFDVFDEYLDEIEDLGESSKKAFKFKLKPLKRSSFYIPELVKDITKAINLGINVNFNMEGFDNISTAGGFPHVVVGMTLRQIVNARRVGKIPPIWIFFDEAARFIPRDGDNSVKKQVLESVELDSRYHINYCFATQTVERVPELILSNSRYFLIPYSADISTFKQIWSLVGLARNVQIMNNTVIRVKKRLKKYDWVLVDKTLSRYQIVHPIPPLCSVCETGN